MSTTKLISEMHPIIQLTVLRFMSSFNSTRLMKVKFSLSYNLDSSMLIATTLIFFVFLESRVCWESDSASCIFLFWRNPNYSSNIISRRIFFNIVATLFYINFSIKLQQDIGKSLQNIQIFNLSGSMQQISSLEIPRLYPCPEIL